MAGKFKFVALGVVAFGLLLGVAFGLGVKVGKGKAPDAAAGGLTAQQVLSLVGGSGGGAGGAGGAGGSGGSGGGGGANSALAGLTSGKITGVQGQTVMVETRPGTTVKVNLGQTTTVNKSASGAPADLTPGMSVLVQGARAADGTVTATSVNLLPPELATVFAGLGGGGTGGTGGTGGAGGASGSPAPAAPTPAR